MTSFWDRSWAQVDPARLTHYLRGTARELVEKDPILCALRANGAHTVCDAGCGCGVWMLRLMEQGFAVRGFDISAQAVQTAERLLAGVAPGAALKTASVLSTGYPDACFDAVVCRDVIDHMPRAEAAEAFRELYRITRPGGMVLATLDHTDGEYEAEPHRVNDDGDYEFTSGRWEGMVFHPYSRRKLMPLMPAGAACELADDGESILVKLTRPGFPA